MQDDLVLLFVTLLSSIIALPFSLLGSPHSGKCLYNPEIDCPGIKDHRQMALSRNKIA